MAVMLKTAIESPEIPRDAWISAGVPAKTIEGFVDTLEQALNPLENIRDTNRGLPISSAILHTEIEPTENDFYCVPGYPTPKLLQSATAPNAFTQPLDYENHLFTLNRDSPIDVNSIVSIKTSNRFAIEGSAERRFYTQQVMLDVSLGSGVINLGVGSENNGDKLTVREAKLTPIDTSEVTSTHLFIARVAVDDTLLSLIKP